MRGEWKKMPKRNVPKKPTKAMKRQSPPSRKKPPKRAPTKRGMGYTA